MCAIAGIIGEKTENISSMMNAQIHRGPDDLNTFIGDGISIGMARLEIIDLVSRGLCLYRYEDFILTYNGEVYNYIQLRTELESLGVKFETNSDTEVVLKSYIEWGFDCFSKFNGMFALGIFDSKKNKIILARDITGEKPLYYYTSGKTFAFASEAKSFVDNFPLSNNQDTAFFNAFQHCLHTTLYKEVNALPPASYMVIDKNSMKYEINKYWNFKQRDINLNTADEELESLLSDSVKLRTQSDVPYGLYFSGGLDSSLISTFHDFDHKYFFDNKLEWKKEFYQNIKKIAWHLDFPVGSLSSFPLWKLAEKASNNVKVVLSGEGADEIFSGYVRYLPVAQEYNIKKAYPSYTSYLFKKYYKFESFLDGFTSLTIREKESFEVVRENMKPYFEMFDDPINAMGYADFNLVMPSLLQMGDRMSSAFSLENRCPFLDKRIIEFGFSLPSEYKIKVLEQKFILRKLAAKRGLVNALDMEKKGLIVVFNKWENKEDWNRSYYFDFLKSNSPSIIKFKNK